MKQAVLVSKQKIIFREVPRPTCGPNQVLIKIKRIGICGSDIHAYYGQHPYISFPIVQGHEFSGEVVEIGQEVQNFKIGDRVTVRPQLTCGQCYPCRHGNYHICENLKVIGCQADGAAQEYLAVNQELVVPLPDELSSDSGAMVEPSAVGVHAARRLREVRGKKILVLGSGPIGLLTAQAVKALGAHQVMITDLSDYRLEVAQKCGLDFTVNVKKTDLDRAIQQHFGLDLADGIIECVGAEETVEQAIEQARKGTDIIIVGVFGAKPRINLGFVQDRELRLIGSLMYKKEDYEVAIEFIRSQKIKVKPLISAHFRFENYPQAYKYIEQNKEKTLKVLIDF